MSVNVIKAEVVSLHIGSGDGHMQDVQRIRMQLDGVAGDRYQSLTRVAWEGDKSPAGTLRRNERQWSAVSTEELDAIADEMGLDAPLTGAALGVNLCIRGVRDFSRLPKGSLMKFPSGAELTVVEYNSPCREQGARIAANYRTLDGQPPTPAAFSKAAKLRRGLVGVVDVAGPIALGDAVSVEVYATPSWLVRSPD